jgi:glyoxylase-like metal-dependent hydrolase (beta-lactamase superfamily II)
MLARHLNVGRGLSAGLLVAGVLLLGAAADVRADEPVADPGRLDLVEVSPSVVMARHDFKANITCIALDDGLLFVDTGLSTEVAARFRSAMEKRFEKKTTALLLTHAHIDHFLGMGAFADVKVVAARAAKDLMERQLAGLFEEKAIEAYTGVFPMFGQAIGSAKPFLPSVWFEDEISFGTEERRVVFRNTGGHSSCSSHVYFAAEGVLVGGDLVQVDQHPYFGDPTTDLGKWIGALRAWEGMNVKKVCPGHGRVVETAYLTSIREFFESMVSTVRRLKAEGVGATEVASHPDLPSGYWGEGASPPRWWGFSIRSLYQTL